MINLYTGTQGSGKSLHTTKDIIFTIKAGGCLILNFPIYLENVKLKIHKETEVYILNDEELEQSPQKIINIINSYIARHGVRYTCVILDEAQRYFDSREWNKKGRKEWLSFFSLHRHIGRDYIDIILITQVDTYLDKRLLKGLIEYKYVHRNLLYSGLLGRILGLFLPAVCYYYPVWMPAKKDERGSLLIGRKKYRNLYDTNLYATTNINNCEKAGDTE